MLIANSRGTESSLSIEHLMANRLARCKLSKGMVALMTSAPFHARLRFELCLLDTAAAAFRPLLVPFRRRSSKAGGTISEVIRFAILVVSLVITLGAEVVVVIGKNLGPPRPVR